MTGDVRAVRLSALALEDLVALHRWIAADAGRAIADAVLDRIEARIASLAAFPDRGTPRDDLAPGVRTMPFERSVTIAWRVDPDAVLVLRVVSARRDLGVLLG